MQRKDIKVRSSTGGEFDCYLVTPEGGGKVPAMVLASAVHGVDQDMRAIADEFASHGYIAAAPAPVQEAYRAVPARMKNVDVNIFPGVFHGYMMRDNKKAFSEDMYKFSMGRALALLKGLRGEGQARRTA